MKKLRYSVTLFLIIALCFSCAQQNLTNNAKVKTIMSTEKALKQDTSIKGYVQFPLPEFKTKAASNDIAANATVSILYPPDYSDISLKNTTIAVGLTDNQGNFIINLNSSFRPQSGDIFVLEARKRLGGEGKSILSVKTFIEWSGNNWDSITYPSIYINSETTALTIISGYNPLLVRTVDTIKKIEVVNGNSILIDINPTATAIRISEVSNLVNQILLNNQDPVENIGYSNGIYFPLYYHPTSPPLGLSINIVDVSPSPVSIQ